MDAPANVESQKGRRAARAMLHAALRVVTRTRSPLPSNALKPRIVVCAKKHVLNTIEHVHTYTTMNAYAAFGCTLQLFVAAPVHAYPHARINTAQTSTL